MSLLSRLPAGRAPWVGLLCATTMACCFPADAAVPGLDRPAVQTASAARSVLQAAARAGHRLVAVGERGIVILSDDDGKTWRQVAVPVSVGLTAVRFVDERHGWITGHGGVVLATEDGGASWTKQLDGRQAARLLLDDATAAGDDRARVQAERLVADGADKPLLDVYPVDALHGLVVGAYNLAFFTEDGGHRWKPLSRRLDNPRGLHLYSIRARGDEIVIAGEQGLVLRSTDRGLSFRRLALPYAGSFFTAELPRGSHDIVVAGLRGNAWRSTDGGQTWAALPSPVPASFTASAVDALGRVWLGNQAGMVFEVRGGELLRAAIQPSPINGLLPLDGKAMLGLSYGGVTTMTIDERGAQ